MNGAEGMAAIVFLGLGNLAWPALFAARKIAAAARPPKPKADKAPAASTASTAAAAANPATAAPEPSP